MEQSGGLKLDTKFILPVEVNLAKPFGEVNRPRKDNVQVTPPP
jgi:hypothetical protein